MQQLAAQRIVETLYRMLRSAVSRLQWDAAVGESGTYLNYDTAVSREHSLERGECAVNIAEVGYVRDALIICRRHFPDRRKNRNHCVVDPYVDWPKLAFNCLGRSIDFVRVGYVHCQNQRASAEIFHLTSCGFKSVSSASKECDMSTLERKRTDDRAAQAGRRSRYHHHLRSARGYRTPFAFG